MKNSQAIQRGKEPVWAQKFKHTVLFFLCKITILNNIGLGKQNKQKNLFFSPHSSKHWNNQLPHHNTQQYSSGSHLAATIQHHWPQWTTQRLQTVCGQNQWESDSHWHSGGTATSLFCDWSGGVGHLPLQYCHVHRGRWSTQCTAAGHHAQYQWVWPPGDLGL